MDSIAFSIGKVHFYWYGMTISAAVALGVLFCFFQMKVRGLNDRGAIAEFLIYGVLFGLLSARLAYSIQHWEWYVSQPWQSLNFMQGGLSIYGAFGGFLLAVWWRSRKSKREAWFWLDVLLPPMALGLAVVQTGHFIFQAVIGMPDNGKIAEYIEYAFRPSGFEQYEYFQPVALYQALWQLLICFSGSFLQYMQRKRSVLPNGGIFLLGIAFGCAGRFFCGFYYLSTAQGLQFEQLLTLAGAMFCLGVLWFRCKKSTAVSLQNRTSGFGGYIQYGMACILLLLLPVLAAGPRILEEKYHEISKGNVNVTILNYHKVDDMKIALSVSPKEFDEQMAFLKSQGYHSITPKQLMDFIEQGGALPDKPLLITFDDGYADNYTNAFPILKKYGYCATVFIVTDFISSDQRFMTWEQVSELQANGFTIGSHTMQHLPLTDLDVSTMQRELIGSKEALKKQLGVTEFYFAYPTGAYDLSIASAVKECGYRAAFTIRYGNTDKASYPYALERIPVFKSGQTFRSFCLRVELTSFFERLGLVRT